jgi:C-terminal processing protease CtpA/Prc
MVKGEKDDGSEFTKTVMLPVGDSKTAAERLAEIGIETRNEEGKTLIDNVVFSSAAEKAGIDFDQEILNIQVPAKRPPKQIMFIPAILLLSLVWFIQRGRSRKLEEAT